MKAYAVLEKQAFCVNVLRQKKKNICLGSFRFGIGRFQIFNLSLHNVLKEERISLQQEEEGQARPLSVHKLAHVFCMVLNIALQKTLCFLSSSPVLVFCSCSGE